MGVYACLGVWCCRMQIRVPYEHADISACLVAQEAGQAIDKETKQSFLDIAACHLASPEGRPVIN